MRGLGRECHLRSWLPLRSAGVFTLRAPKMTQNGDKGKGCYRCTPQRPARGKIAAPSPPRADDQGERRSPHPFIARIPLTFAPLLPLLIALLLFLLLGTASLPVVALFLIHLPLVGGGLIDAWP